MKKILLGGLIAFILVLGLQTVKTRRFNAPSSLSAADTLTKLNTDIDKSRRTAIVRAAEEISPSVVSISVLSRVVASVPFFEDPFFGEFWREFFPPRLYEREVQSLGSGVIISRSGYIVTNAHVVKDAESIKVTLPDGRTFDGEIVGIADKFDIALVKVNGKDLPVAKIGNSDNLLIGEWVIAVGNPFGFLLEDLQPTVTVGVVSALHRTIKGRSERIYRDMIQTDAAINPGNSGGPLVNALGEVIGINTFIFTKSGGSEGIGFAIPINTVMRIVGELKKYGHMREGYLGFTVQDMDKDLKEAMGYPYTFGVLVNSVDPGGPASGKIHERDIIMTMDNRKIYNTGDFEDITYALVPEQTISLKVWRDGKKYMVTVRSAEFKLNEQDIGFGLTVAKVTPAVADKFGLAVSEGVLVVNIEYGSVFNRLGIEKGDVILAVNGTLIKTPEDLKEVLKNLEPGYVKFLVDRKGQRLWFTGIFRY